MSMVFLDLQIMACLLGSHVLVCSITLRYLTKFAKIMIELYSENIIKCCLKPQGIEP